MDRRYLALFIVLAITILCVLPIDDAEPSPPPLAQTEPVYDMETLRAPRLVGVPLRLFTWIIEKSFLRHWILKKLMADNKYSSVNDFAATIPHTPPSFLPLRPVTPEEQASHEASAAKFDINKFVLSTSDSPQSKYHHRWTIADYVGAYTSGVITPSEVAERVIDSMRASAKTVPKLAAMIQINEDDIREQAKASAQRYKAGRPLGVLDGVPIPVKDELDQKGFATTVGTTFLGQKNGVAQHDSEAVARLRAAGALLIGKTNLHEIGIGTTGFNAHYGPARNPYSTSHYTGGSSSGSAAAVAAGFSPVAVSADGGGSIRVPAALTGTVGLKATFGRVSERGGAPLCWTIGHYGPIAATVRDAAIAYALMAGPDPNDLSTLTQPPVHLEGFTNVDDLKDITLGIYWDHYSDADDEVVAATYQVVKGLVSRGAKLVNITIPSLATVDRSHKLTILSEMRTALDPYMNQFGSDLALDTRISLAVATAITNRDYIAAQKVRAWMIKYWSDNIWNKVDIVVSPTTGRTAPVIPDDAIPLGESNLPVVAELMRFVFTGNFQGYPAIAVPTGFDSNLLPISLQLMSDHWTENTLLRVAHAAEHVRVGLEEASNGGPSLFRVQRPQQYYSILDPHYHAATAPAPIAVAKEDKTDL